MKENREIKLDEVLEELYFLREENQQLKVDNDFLQRKVDYLTSAEAGRDFARSLLGKPMTDEDLAIEAAENAYVPYNGDDF